MAPDAPIVTDRRVAERSRTAAARTAVVSTRADAGHEVEVQKNRRAPQPLELDPEHPDRQHVEQDVQQAARGGTCR